MRKDLFQQRITETLGGVSLLSSNSASITTFLGEDFVDATGPGCRCKRSLVEKLPLSSPVQVNGEDLQKILSAMPSPEEFQMVLSESSLTFRQNRFKAALPLMEGGMEEMEDAPEGFLINSGEWASWQMAAPFASAPNNTSMPELSSVFQNEEGIWACNRLSMIQISSHKNSLSNIYFPKMAIAALQKMKTEPKEIGFQEGKILFTLEDGVLEVSQLSSDFPIEGLRNIMEREKSGAEWTSSKKDMNEGLGSLSGLTEQVHLSFQAKRLILSGVGNLSSQYQVLGKVSGEIPKEKFLIPIEELKRIVDLSIGEEILWNVDGDRGVLFVQGEDFQACISLTVEESEEEA